LWQDEFSVFTADERYVNRRQFTKFLTLTSLAMFVGNLWILARSWLSTEPAWPAVPIAQAGDLAVGGSRLFTYPTAQESCILIRTGDNEWAAYSQKCTHLSCAVYYEAEHRRLVCPCHKGYFSIADGAVLQGPPQRPLPRVVIERRGEELVALRMQLGREA
jgi:Rieske Fe-S protein